MLTQGTIRLCYRKVIDNNSGRPWEKFVFEDSYTEFLLQSQLYNRDKKFNSFGEILHGTPGAEKLHFLVSASVTGYVKQLNEKIPDIVNSLGKQFLSFTHYRFEIINSDLSDRTKHQVAINFYSAPLNWHATIGNHLLVSAGQISDTGEVLTDTFSMVPFLSIYSIT